MVKSNNWIPIKLEGPIVSGDMDGLIGIEELTDYDLDTVLQTNKGHTKKRKSLESKKLPVKKLKKNSKEGTEILGIKSIDRSEPGAFVRNPNFSSNKVINTSDIDENDTDTSEFKKSNNENSNKKQKKKKSKTKTSTENKSISIDNNTKLETVKPIKQMKKPKVEIGVRKKNESIDEIKCNVDDLKAWSAVPLPDELLRALADLGFTKPTPIQELTLAPAMLGRRDILGAAETGSGKTLAFGLPILSGILKLREEATQQETEDAMLNQVEEQDSDASDFEERDEDVEGIDENGIGCVRSVDNITPGVPHAKSRKPLYALVLTPTRELAVQVKNHLAAVARHTGVRVAAVLGGMAAVKQERLLAAGPEIVVATPGRLWELVQEGNPHLAQVNDIRYLAIDETDRMLERGHYQELHQLLERINADDSKRTRRQNFVFSATLTLVHDLPKHLLNKKRFKGRGSKHVSQITSKQKLQKIIEMLGISNPKVVDVTQAKGTASTLTECRINCAIEDKDYYVYYFLQQHPGRTLIFCNSIGCVKRLATLLGLLCCTSLPLHASMQQRQRLKNLERFRDDPLAVLVATDVAARGLDIPSVEHVLHYQTPRTSEGYVHRSGRTARASEEGITVLLVEPNEIPNYQRLCRTLGRTEDLPVFPVFENLLAAVKQRMNLARELDKLELKTRRTNSEAGWLQKAAEDMDIVLDQDIDSDGGEAADAAQLKRNCDLMRKQLTSLLAKPVFPRGFSFRYPLRSGQQDIPLVQGEQTKSTAVELVRSSELQRLEVGKNKGKSRKLYKPTVKTSVAEKIAVRKAEKALVKRNKRKIKKAKNCKELQ